MGRAVLTRPALLALAALVVVLPGINAHGFWFDEAYTARVATLVWSRLLAAAQLDIHPPGWPVVAGLFLAFPIPAEWALRLPAVLSFAALVAIVGSRNLLGGAALFFYSPLVEQASQGRPYVPMALGLVVLVRLLEREAWLWAGLTIAVVSALHALGGPMCVALLLGSLGRRVPARGMLAIVAPPMVLSAWWLPNFLATSAAYVRQPWYTAASATDWWIVSDAGGAAVAAVIIVLIAAVSRNPGAVAPAAAVGALLLALDAAGIGAEVRKTGLVILPLLLAGLTPRIATPAAIACLVVLGLRSAQIPDRPDLREAYAAVQRLPHDFPVVSVFASEAAWYFRTPAPLPSFREPAAIGARLQEVVDSQNAPCIVSIALPGTFPEGTELPESLRTVLVADVTGLDVRVVGTRNCAVTGEREGWISPG